MDGQLWSTTRKETHMAKLEDLQKTLLKTWLKISPKKCLSLRKELEYTGSTTFTKERRDCVKPLRSRLEAIQELKPASTIKGCRS